MLTEYENEKAVSGLNTELVDSPIIVEELIRFKVLVKNIHSIFEEKEKYFLNLFGSINKKLETIFSSEKTLVKLNREIEILLEIVGLILADKLAILSKTDLIKHLLHVF